MAYNTTTSKKCNTSMNTKWLHAMYLPKLSTNTEKNKVLCVITFTTFNVVVD